MGRMQGKIAIVTGASGGIGQATARLLLQEGASVMLVDRDASVLRALASELGPQAAWAAADVSSAADSERYVRATRERFGGVDVLFANAGIEGTVAPITQLDVDAFDRVLAVNVRGVFLGMKYAMPELAARGGGSIVVTSSVAGLLGSPGLAAYVASKHALIGLARSAALEGAPQRIRVNTVNPGPIDNRMMRGIEGQIAPSQPEEVKRGFEGQVPMGRYGQNEEIARLALFLCSDESSYCTGGVFVADGGFTAH